MKEKDRVQFYAYLTGLAEIFDTELTAPRMNLYFESLKDLSIEDVNAACNHVAKTSRFFPKPVELRESTEGSIEDQAIMAIQKIRGAARYAGGYRSVVFDDPILHVIIENFGGWPRITDVDSEEWKWVEKDLIKQYKAYAGRGVDHASITPKLAGLHDLGNNAKGIDLELEPVVIGDLKKAFEWTKLEALNPAGNRALGA